MFDFICMNCYVVIWSKQRACNPFRLGLFFPRHVDLVVIYIYYYYYILAKQIETEPPFYMVELIKLLCLDLCVCVCERESEREREIVSGLLYLRFTIILPHSYIIHNWRLIESQIRTFYSLFTHKRQKLPILRLHEIPEMEKKKLQIAWSVGMP